MTNQRHQIVCGVGDTGSPAAVRFAAREAARHRADLHLVRVVAYPFLDYVGVSEETPGTTEANALLDEARARALEGFPDLTVTQEVIDTGWVASGLTDSTGSADLLVIEQTSHGHLHRFVTGATADGVALRTPVPVVVVPRAWDATDERPGVVTVAVQDTDEAALLIGAAFDEAAALQAEVHVLHVIWLVGGFDLSGDMQRAWIERATADLAGVVEDLEALHPDVKARIDVVQAPPADAIAAASSTAGLLVLGRRQHLRPWGSHLGPVAHRVLLEAGCPVLLPPPSSTDAPSDTAADIPDESRAGDDGRAAQSEAGPDDVVVGIGTSDASSALAFAATEGLRRGTGVHVVHAVPVPSVDGTMLPEAWMEALAEGRRVVAAAADTVRDDAPGLASVTEQIVERGQVAATLAAQADRGGLLVLQHRRLGTLRRLVTHSVTNAVASRARGLVVAVPDGWATPATVGRVVVGVADPDWTAATLDVAYAEASRRKAPLVVVHSTWMGGNPEAMTLNRTMITEWADRARSNLAASTDRRREQFPDVGVTLVVEHVPPTELLGRYAEADDLLVIEARRHFWAVPSHLGPVTRGLLGVAPCPVLLVPAAGTHPA